MVPKVNKLVPDGPLSVPFWSTLESKKGAGKHLPSAAGKHLPSAAGKHLPSAAGKHLPSAAGKHLPSAAGKRPPFSEEEFQEKEKGQVNTCPLTSEDILMGLCLLGKPVAYAPLTMKELRLVGVQFDLVP